MECLLFCYGEFLKVCLLFERSSPERTSWVKANSALSCENETKIVKITHSAEILHFLYKFASFWNLTSVFQPLKEFIPHQKQVSRDLTNWNLLWSETSIVQLLWILWKYYCNVFGNFKIIKFILKYKCIHFGKYFIT